MKNPQFVVDGYGRSDLDQGFIGNFTKSKKNLFSVNNHLYGFMYIYYYIYFNIFVHLKVIAGS